MVAWLLPIHIDAARLSLSPRLAPPPFGPGGCSLANCACPPGTINDIGPWFSRRYDGTTAGFYPVSPLSSSAFVSGNSSALLSLFLPLFTPFFSSSVRERRQVGIRAAVNSPAPLSALMSLLLFALLNAIRAYSVSLSPAAPRLASLCATPSLLALFSSRLLLVFGSVLLPPTVHGPCNPVLVATNAKSCVEWLWPGVGSDAPNRLKNYTFLCIFKYDYFLEKLYRGNYSRILECQLLIT